MKKLIYANKGKIVLIGSMKLLPRLVFLTVRKFNFLWQMKVEVNTPRGILIQFKDLISIFIGPKNTKKWSSS